MPCRPLLTLMIATLVLLGCAEKPDPQKEPFEAATHVIAPAAGYYRSVPQQGQQPDGEFPAGTKVEILEETDEYIKVRTADGTEAYLLPGAAKKETPEG